MNSAGELLRNWLTVHNVTRAELALKVGCGSCYIGHLVTSIRTPSMEIAAGIYVATDGEIEPNHWAGVNPKGDRLAA